MEEKDIARDLIAINPESPGLNWNADKTKILVVTWKSQSSYERFIKPNTNTSPDEANVVWVTTVPQVQQFCRDYAQNTPDATKDMIDLRLKQYLGLNAAWNYDVFVEMWVSPGDLFRPCVDPEINDSACELAFKNPAPQVKGIRSYPDFYKNLYFSDFRTQPGVPWTGLGYTYDWGSPQKPEGASEFILTPGAGYQINKVFTTAEYCQAQ